MLSIGLAVMSCKKDDEPVADNNSNNGGGQETADTTVTDIDGNIYKTVVIGSQTWMAENLRVSKYANGDVIPDLPSDANWSTASSGAVSSYLNKGIEEDTAYGKYYNWYAVEDSRNVCPTGWHVPNDVEWSALGGALGGNSVAGGKMKVTGTTYWNTPNTSATNESGFSARSTAFRWLDGLWETKGNCTMFWSATEFDTDKAYVWELNNSFGSIGSLETSKKGGMVIRCLKDD